MKQTCNFKVIITRGCHFPKLSQSVRGRNDFVLGLVGSLVVGSRCGERSLYYGETILYYKDNLELVGGSSVVASSCGERGLYYGETVLYYGDNLGLVVGLSVVGASC